MPLPEAVTMATFSADALPVTVRSSSGRPHAGGLDPETFFVPENHNRREAA
jgi:hypothetical protein